MLDSRILIVDEKNGCSTLTQTLQPLGYEIETVMNGDEALKRLKEQEFDLMLLDLSVPEMNGLEFLRRIIEGHPEVRVVLISAQGAVDEAIAAMKLGAIDFRQKPLAPQELCQLVAEHTEGRTFGILGEPRVNVLELNLAPDTAQ